METVEKLKQLLQISSDAGYIIHKQKGDAKFAALVLASVTLEANDQERSRTALSPLLATYHFKQDQLTSDEKKLFIQVDEFVNK